MLGLGEDRLSIYLNDHLAGATAGANLARRLARHDGEVLAVLADEIAQDRRSLIEIMDALDVQQDVVKGAVAWAAEKASRLKFNGELIGYSALSRLEELEALSLGVEGKLALWRALQHTHGDDLAAFDLEQLIARARSQRRRLEAQRTRAAEDAFG
jgi:hypothetical protein